MIKIITAAVRLFQNFYDAWIRIEEPYDPSWMDYNMWKESRIS